MINDIDYTLNTLIFFFRLMLVGLFGPFNVERHCVTIESILQGCNRLCVA